MKNKIIIAVSFVLLLFSGVSVYLLNRPRNVKVIYLDDDYDSLDERFIWDEKGNLLSPDALPDLLGMKDSIVHVNTQTNGKVVYVYKMQGGGLKKDHVFKQKLNTERFYVHLNNDTLSVNDTVVLDIGIYNLPKSQFDIKIEKDTLYDVEENEFSQVYNRIYRRSSFTQKAVHSFDGVIVIGGDTYEIHYNYVIQ